MATGVKQLDIRQIEASLARLRDVHAARVSLNAACDDVEEVHVLASRSRTPKQIVRDIESLLYVKFRTRIDYRRVSLAQVSAQDLLSYFGRPKLTSVRQDTGDGLVVEVCLAYGHELSAVGRAHGQSDASSASRVAALATLQAVSGILDHSENVVLEGVEAMPMDHRTVILVHLTRQTDHGEEHLLGVSFAEPDVIHGAVRATLDAVNRRLF